MALPKRPVGRRGCLIAGPASGPSFIASKAMRKRVFYSAAQREVVRMATQIRVPTLDESVTEAAIARWFKKPGDAVKADEPLLELETDKVTLEVNAPAAGVLAEVTAKDGETVSPGGLLGQIAE